MSTIKIYLASETPNTDNLKDFCLAISPALGGLTVLPALFGTWVDPRTNEVGIDDYSYILIAESSVDDTILSLINVNLRGYLKRENQYAALLCVDSDPRLVSQDS